MPLVGVAILWVGCEGFGATPAELAKTQILAIRAEPPGIRPGETATLSILVADPDGAVADPDVSWELVSDTADEPPLGTVAIGADGGVTYDAPDSIPGDVLQESIVARVSAADGELAALKVIAVGDESLSNPALTAFTVDGSDILTGRSVTLAREQTVELSIGIDVAADGSAAVSWFATIGIIDQYRSNPTELVVQDELGSGWLFAVVRDGLGGAVWEEIAVTVE
ncbi:MAG: hypothetical protein AAGC55_11935 [Myxococcota bacterium]